VNLRGEGGGFVDASKLSSWPNIRDRRIGDFLDILLILSASLPVE
jgi:hypothetical protein